MTKEEIVGNSHLKEAKRVLNFAQREINKAKKTKNEIKARQAAEKGYLALLEIVNALLVEKGVKEEELPKGERGRMFFLRKHADRDFRNKYDAIYKSLHIDAFHEGIIDFKNIEEKFEDLEELLNRIEQKRVW